MYVLADCVHDSNGGIAGDSAGDQGGEFGVWANCYRWQRVFNPKSALLARRIAKKAQEAALNDHIGYDQDQRHTFFKALKTANWQPASIKKRCETDCSACTLAILVACGYEMNIPELIALEPYADGTCTGWTGNIPELLKGTGLFYCNTRTTWTRFDSTRVLPGCICHCHSGKLQHVAISI